ncbi:MAG: acetyl-CoA carboxylase biotin carboxyl carrier protein [Gemmatimonadota bacterium]|nr:acetyl-CoA carboxylase biotin carboxyl carrier protein [Gemmatimonadota bacterium]
MIDLDWIRQLIDLLDQSAVDSLEISRLGTRVRISKSPPIHYVGAGGGAVPMAARPEPLPSAPGGGTAPPSQAPPGDRDAGSAVSFDEVLSPMVGTFYRSPAPDAPSYVEVGDRVRKGQVLCILEAMKLMNELEAEIAGTVREICVGNGDPVEYGQTLFRIESD